MFIKKEILNTTGQWNLPVIENQKRGLFDTKSCTVFGTLNCLEILNMYQYCESIDFSDRYTAFFTGAKKSGYSTSDVIKAINDWGLVREEVYPFDCESFEEYYKPITDEIVSLAKPYKVSCNNLFLCPFVDKKKKLMEALKFSPVGISVFSWSKGDNGLYTRPKVFRNDNHFVCLYGYEDGKCWKVLDSYENNLKELDWNYPFQYAYGYEMQKMVY